MSTLISLLLAASPPPPIDGIETARLVRTICLPVARVGGTMAAGFAAAKQAGLTPKPVHLGYHDYVGVGFKVSLIETSPGSRSCSVLVPHKIDGAPVAQLATELGMTRADPGDYAARWEGAHMALSGGNDVDDETGQGVEVVLVSLR